MKLREIILCLTDISDQLIKLDRQSDAQTRRKLLRVIKWPITLKNIRLGIKATSRLIYGLVDLKIMDATCKW
jgi:hypothetical protein